MKIDPNKLYKVYWQDIVNFTNEKVELPYINYTSECWSIGYIKQDKSTLLIINSHNDDDEVCGDAIPLGCVKKIICLE